MAKTASQPKAKVKVPNFANATPGFLVDELGEVRAKLKELQGQEGVLKEALQARLPKGTTAVTGEKYNAAITQTSQVRLDTDKIRSEMPEEWVAEHSKEITFTTIRTSRLAN